MVAISLSKALALMAIVLPSIVHAAPAVPLGPDILPHTHNPGHGIRIVDFLLSPSLSPSDKGKLLKQAIAREQAEAAASGRKKKHPAPKHPDDTRRLRERQMQWRILRKHRKGGPQRSVAETISQLESDLKNGTGKDTGKDTRKDTRKETGKDKRNYKGPLSNDDNIMINKTVANGPRYLRKEHIVRRPTLHCPHKTTEGKCSKL
ncbi:hypothetical protein ACHAP5_000038 [Fusarium lateritium]